MSTEPKDITKALNSLGNKKYSFIRDYLFKEANHYAILQDGDTAVQLHEVANSLVPVIKTFEPSYFK